MGSLQRRERKNPVRGAASAAGAILLLVVGCMPGPTTTDIAYREKADQSAEDLLSPARTGIFIAQVFDGGQMFHTSADVAISDVEDAARSVRRTFATRQPPTPDAELLRVRLMSLADEAVHSLAGLRIAMRHDNMDAVHQAERELTETAEALEAVEERTQ